MMIAHYIGPPKPGVLAYLGWWAIRTGQKGPFDHCTHTEAIHDYHGANTFTIASSSLHDKGVRIKRATLTPGHWIITQVPIWPVQKSQRWFEQAIARRMQYDKRGALATMLPGKQDDDKVFCTESVLAPFVHAPHYYQPAQGLSLCLSLGRDVTDEVLCAPDS
jgi:hypothetical protein